MKIAIITGASSGLGRDYALAADRDGIYDEIWVVARRLERLQELELDCRTPVRPFALDLTERSAIAVLYGALEAADCEVGMLVNAAGFAKFGNCDDLTLEEVDSMIELNCRALVDLTQVCLKRMGRGGRIIQVASSASFIPMPGLNVYAASKAFVRSYTRALRFELRRRGIHTTAVCPVWIKTEFVQVARDTANGQTVKHTWPQLSSKHVVRWSRLINRINYPIATCCVTGALMRIVSKVIPDSLMMWMWEGLRRI